MSNFSLLGHKTISKSRDYHIFEIINISIFLPIEFLGTEKINMYLSCKNLFNISISHSECEYI